nr:hypothetical protein [Streptomyces sp. 351MFTsu5.1]
MAIGLDCLGDRVLVAAAEKQFTLADIGVAQLLHPQARGPLGRPQMKNGLLVGEGDIAYLDRRLRVIAVRTMKPGRLGLPRLRARHVVEAGAGVMEGWGVGVRVGVRARVEVVSE